MRVLMAILLCMVVSTAFAQENRRRTEMVEPRSADELVRQLSVQAPLGQPIQVSVALQVQFEFASARLTRDGTRVLDIVAMALNDPAMVNLAFLIEGHTDAVGSDLDNLQLSKSRAQSVYEYLQFRGVAAARLNTAGYGELRPIPGTHGEDPRNRRVEIVRLG